MDEQCPHCHNIVVGRFSPSDTRKWLTSLAKKGGMKAVLTAVGSVVPGFGNISGFLAGTAIDVIYGENINKLVDKLADEFDDNKVYVFECPNCGHTWTRKEDELAYYLLNGNYSEEEEEDDDDEGDDPMASQFDQSLAYLLNEIDEVINSVPTIEAFMHKMNVYAGQSGSSYMRAAFYFLSAFSGLLFFKDGNAHENLKRNIADRAISQIGRAISLHGFDEYRIIERLLRIQTIDNVNDLFQSIRVATACKVNQDSWLKKEYYQKSLVPDICFFKILDIDRDMSISSDNKAKLWKTLINSPVKDYRMYANLRVYIHLSDTDKSADKYLKAAFESKGFSLDRPDIESPMFVQWLWSAVDYAELLCCGGSNLIGKDYTKGMKMLHTIAELGHAAPCLAGRLTLGEMKEKEGDLQKALAYYIKAGEMGAEDATRVRKLIADNSKHTSTISTKSLPNKMVSDMESEYVDEVKACFEDGGEISKGERRLLEKIRIKLGITEERAAELEQSLTAPQLTENEQEYLAEYRECLAEEGEISAGERRLLNRLRDKLGISEERASELEQI